MGQTPIQSSDIWAPSLAEERCLPERALTDRTGERDILCPMSLGDQYVQVSAPGGSYSLSFCQKTKEGLSTPGDTRKH